MRADRLAVALASLVVLSSLALGGTAAVPTPASQPQPQPPTVEDAPPGTVFTSLVRGGERVDGPVGILKRGRTGGALYNPSTDSIALRPGDVLVDRSGRRYRMTIHQRHPGGSGVVGAGATVYPGETGLWFVGFAEPQLEWFPEPVVGGAVLGLDGSVPADQRPGIYRGRTFRTRAILDVDETQLTAIQELTVRAARVSDLRVVDSRGEPVEPGATLPAEGFVVVSARVNFLDAERARIALVDPETETTITRGALSRAEALARFPAHAGFIERTVPAGKARPEGPDGTARSLANPANEPTTTIYLVQDLGALADAGTVEVVVSADDRPPFGDLYSVGVRRSTSFVVESAAAGESRRLPRPRPRFMALAVERRPGIR